MYHLFQVSKNLIFSCWFPLQQNGSLLTTLDILELISAYLQTAISSKQPCYCSNIWKKKSFLVIILLPKPLDHPGSCAIPTFKNSAPTTISLNCVAFAFVFGFMRTLEEFSTVTTYNVVFRRSSYISIFCSAERKLFMVNIEYNYHTCTAVIEVQFLCENGGDFFYRYIYSIPSLVTVWTNKYSNLDCCQSYLSG